LPYAEFVLATGFDGAVHAADRNVGEANHQRRSSARRFFAHETTRPAIPFRARRRPRPPHPKPASRDDSRSAPRIGWDG
jgi:hypothetical protein